MTPAEHYRRGELCLDDIGNMRTDEEQMPPEYQLCVLVEALAHFTAATVPVPGGRPAEQSAVRARDAWRDGFLIGRANRGGSL